MHFTDYYLKNGEHFRAGWGHDPDPFEVISFANDCLGGWDKVYTTDSFPANGPIYMKYQFCNGEWVLNEDISEFDLL